jgi:hypothetical protein
VFARRVHVAAPPRVADRLAAADGPVPVLHRGRQAIYLGLGDGCVGVVSRGAAGVPCALRLAAPDLGVLARVRSARVVGGVLHLDDVALPVGRLVDVRAPAPPAGPTEDLADDLADDLAAALRRAAGLPGKALHLLAAGDPAAVPLLLGRGDGLTPLGDDVLGGWLAARVAAGRPVGRVAETCRARRRATTTLSAELLDCAARGEVLPEYAAWLAAPGGDPAAARTALLAVGHTSGAGLLVGGALALGGPRAAAVASRPVERCGA